MALIKLDEKNFEAEVLKSDVPVLVDFWATWCGPCRMLGPVIEEIAAEAESFKVGKLDTDENGSLAMKYGVMSIPTVILFKNGEEAARSIGVVPKEHLLAMLEG
ncbi:MAG: thioredoxin [Firmicutes bacterium]|nr:thioredoxin [Bacillota bacterium]